MYLKQTGEILGKIAEILDTELIVSLLVISAGLTIYFYFNGNPFYLLTARFAGFFLILLALRPAVAKVFHVEEEKDWGDYNYDIDILTKDAKEVITTLTRDQRGPLSKRNAMKIRRALTLTQRGQTSIVTFEWNLDGTPVPCRFFVKRLNPKTIHLDVSSNKDVIEALRLAHSKVTPHEVDLTQPIVGRHERNSHLYSTGGNL